MASLVFKITYKKNDFLILSPSELIEGYLYGIPLCAKNGQELTQETIKQKIQTAQAEVEKFLYIKFGRQIVYDNVDFIRDEWGGWGFLKCHYPVREALRMDGFINTTQQIQYPMEWVSVTNNGGLNNPSEEYRFERNLHIVPSGSTSTATTNAVIFSGITPHLGFMGLANIPNYWKVQYCTGFTVPPPDLYDLVAKLAAIQLLAILGDILFGVGTTSQSLSLDGLSQSTSLARNGQGGLFGGRIKQYADEIRNKLPQLKNNYIGISFGVL